MIQGTLSIPPSKSQTLRAILFAALAKGKSKIYNALDSADTKAMCKAVQAFGAKVEGNNPLEIEGVAGKPCFNIEKIEAGNSGIVARFLTPLAALSKKGALITGDHSIQVLRPFSALLQALKGLGAICTYQGKEEHPPFHIRGPISGTKVTVEGFDSQFVSALLILASILPQPLEIQVKNPGEIPWVQMTLSWLSKLQVKWEEIAPFHFVVQGSPFSSFTYQVPADFSSAAFPAAAASLCGEVILKNLDPQDGQGDKIFFSWLQELGGKVYWEKGHLHICASTLWGKAIDVNEAIDAVPILAVLGCLSKKGAVLHNAAVARKKESDRLLAISQELQKMGAKIYATPSSLICYPSPLKGAFVSSHKDHRIAMALAVAGLKAKGETILEGIECVQKSYPTFFSHLKQIGANLKVIL